MLSWSPTNTQGRPTCDCQFVGIRYQLVSQISANQPSIHANRSPSNILESCWYSSAPATRRPNTGRRVFKFRIESISANLIWAKQGCLPKHLCIEQPCSPPNLTSLWPIPSQRRCRRRILHKLLADANKLLANRRQLKYSTVCLCSGRPRHWPSDCHALMCAPTR